MTRRLRTQIAALEAAAAARGTPLEVWVNADDSDDSLQLLTDPTRTATHADLARRLLGTPSALLIVEGWPMSRELALRHARRLESGEVSVTA